MSSSLDSGQEIAGAGGGEQDSCYEVGQAVLLQQPAARALAWLALAGLAVTRRAAASALAAMHADVGAA